ncbi:MAG: CDP-alcohol phosphatidyltransferase family protein [Deltaproteobacteria bacterium]|nr:CDP-alcohol phosphatidyltransferase family protein [Deltaproteobacteria bacterium]
MTTEPYPLGRSTGVEAWILRNLCEPLLDIIPSRVHPNALTLLNQVLCWAVFAAAVISPKLGPLPRALALAFAGAGTFGSMLLDCLDGMHARRTHRTTKLGELLDHWLDAIHVPLVTAGLCFALELAPWQAVAVHTTSAMVYNAQLVLYHRSGEFVAPPTSGTEGQLAVSLGYLGLAALHASTFEAPWLGQLISGASLLAAVTQLRICGFYYARIEAIPGAMRGHLPLVLLGFAFGGLYLAGLIDRMAFALLVTFLSFRLTGAYVLHTILGQSFAGSDRWVWVWVAALVLGHPWLEMRRFGLDVPAALIAYGACAFMALRNLVDFARSYSSIPAARAPRD